MIATLHRLIGGALLGAVVVLSLWSIAPWSTGSRAQEGPRKHVVVIEQFGFSPARLTVRPGDNIEWVNRDIAPHTATALEGAWDTGELTRTGRASITVSEPGTFEYICAYHPQMMGEVIVSEADSAGD